MLAAYQGEKYSTNGTSTMTSVGMAGNVRVRADAAVHRRVQPPAGPRRRRA